MTQLTKLEVSMEMQRWDPGLTFWWVEERGIIGQCSLSFDMRDLSAEESCTVEKAFRISMDTGGQMRKRVIFSQNYTTG